MKGIQEFLDYSFNFFVNLRSCPNEKKYIIIYRPTSPKSTKWNACSNNLSILVLHQSPEIFQMLNKNL